MCDVADAEASGGEWGACPLCHGYGMMEIAHSVRLEILPGAQSGDRYQIDLRSEGSETCCSTWRSSLREKALPNRIRKPTLDARNFARPTNSEARIARSRLVTSPR
jgi:hypothetical protein